MDSALVPFDSIFWQKDTFHYAGLDPDPIYIEKLIASQQNIAATKVGTRIQYDINNKVVYDSTYDITMSSPQFNPGNWVDHFTYSGNYIYVSTNITNWINGTRRDTFNIVNGNVVAHNTSYLGSGSTVPVTQTESYTFDNSPNPLPIGWPNQSQAGRFIMNANNVTSYLFTSLMDSIRTVSQFVYDQDGFPVRENKTEHYFYPFNHIRNFIITYRYF
jgi:hypothetical protein